MSRLQTELSSLLTPELCIDHETYIRLLDRIKHDNLTREENPVDHFCGMFIPYNPQTKKIFIVYHKKAKQWIVPGGHVDLGETIEETVIREAKEELGLAITSLPTPIMASILYIQNEGSACRVHNDLWFVIPTTEKFQVDLREFHDTKWVSFSEARQWVTNQTYLEAIKKAEILLK